MRQICGQVCEPAWLFRWLSQHWQTRSCNNYIGPSKDLKTCLSDSSDDNGDIDDEITSINDDNDDDLNEHDSNMQQDANGESLPSNN